MESWKTKKKERKKVTVFHVTLITCFDFNMSEDNQPMLDYYRKSSNQYKDNVSST